MSTRVDDARCSSYTLQPNRLPHEHHLVVGAWRDNDEVAGLGGIDRRLNCLASRHHRRSFAANGDGNGVDRWFAVGGRDDQLTALCGAAPVLRLLLDGAVRYPRGYR